ncbi:uncharacterized protein LOC132739818 [Ruditapes philippinarum]|uniref:uncharacterized protein LOC132739818 n=1 Tax=Ruditapes philippinarum TaxID=129788 RepID=UPI00295BA077|nr:uncharacterized protein LOC132739818 [Ruditapes philippinarum]
MYEPLIAMAEAYYFKNSTTMCTTLLDKCYKTTLTESAVRRMTHMLSCNTNIIEDKYHHKWDTGGEYWLKYHECLLDKDYDKEFCDRFLSDRCKEAKFKVIKTPRLSTQILKTLLQGHSNVTIVHVFRDPRGILFQIMSENSDQAPVSALRKYANSLCSRMRDDLEVGFKLASLYPKRFKLMLFEDFEWDMVTVFKPLFRFVGFPLYRKDKSFVEAISQKKALTEYIKETGNKTRPDSSQQEVLKMTNINPFQWRKQIDVNNLKIIDEYCGDLYIKLGYNVYANVENLRNLSDWSSYGADGVYPL